jgi:16S rRNA (cytosine1402-N4)-methyltransferase
MHISVLKNEVIEAFEYLSDEKSPIFVDGTLGMAGHSSAILSLNPEMTLIGIDKDEEAITIAKKNLENAKIENETKFLNIDFKDAKISIEEELGITKVDGILLDLGVSSLQFDEKERGFSFQDPEQLLDMRMDRKSRYSAFELVNLAHQSKLVEILRNYGEETFATSIARNIIEWRKKKQISTVGDLLEILKYSIPKKVQATGKSHFATKTFQALRIEVNHELEDLDIAISDFVEMLKPGGRIAVISFHSLEDRVVKQTFAKLANPCQCPSQLPCICGLVPTISIITRKPMIPSAEEIAMNPRARSAKLRIAEKI